MNLRPTPRWKTPVSDLETRVAGVRRFNRFITGQIGVLNEGLLRSDFPLTEARILFELGTRPNLTASDLMAELGLDAGYLSRLLSKLAGQGLLERVRSERDKRQWLLSLTPAGRDAFGLLDSRSHAEVTALLGSLDDLEQQRLLCAMQEIESLLGVRQPPSDPIYLRPHEPGDIGWVVAQHGLLYAQEYGWNAQFEALVARICADFLSHDDAERERCWIAELGGERVGSIFCVRESESVAKLRLLLVDPKARGYGLGGKLIDACLSFAKRAGYEKVTLWTNDVLTAARHLYEQRGFSLVSQEAHHSFGKELVGQNWERAL